MSHARAAIAGVLAAVVAILAANGQESVSEINMPVALLILGLIALLLLPDVIARMRGGHARDDV